MCVEGPQRASKRYRGSKSLRSVRRGFEAFEETSRGPKRHRRGSKEIGDFKGGFEGFEGVSHDSRGLGWKGTGAVEGLEWASKTY